MKNEIWKYTELERLLEKKFPLVRRWAFEKLIEFYGKSHISKIAELIDDDDHYVSSGAIRYLSKNHHVKWAFRILRKFQDSSGEVAASCAVALGELGYRDAIHFFQQRVESEEADFETLMGIINALILMPSDEATVLLLLIGENYVSAASGAFMAKLCDALLSTRHRDAVRFVAEMYMEHSFSLDDRGNGILKHIIQHTRSMEFIDEFSLFIDENPNDVLRHIKESVRKRLGDILGDDFIRKTAEKFLKNNYLQLLSDIRKTAEAALYSKRIVSNDEQINSADILGQELLNYHFINRFSSEPRMLNVMSLSEVKKIIILCITSLLRIIYSHKAGQDINIAEINNPDALIKMLDSLPVPDEIISKIESVTASSEIRAEIAGKLANLLKSNGKTLSSINYMKALSRLEPGKRLDIYWDRLSIKYDDAICRTAEDSMVAAGNEAVDFIEKRFDDGDESQKMFSLGILSRLPVKKSVSLIIKKFDSMWEGYRDFVLYAVTELGSEKFLKPVLEKLEQNPLPDVEEAYLLLCDLNGVEDAKLENARNRVIKELEESERKIDFLCDRTKALRRNHCNRKLICRHCNLSRLKAE